MLILKSADSAHYSIITIRRPHEVYELYYQCYVNLFSLQTKLGDYANFTPQKEKKKKKSIEYFEGLFIMLYEERQNPKSKSSI